MNIETITLTPVSVLDRTDERGVPQEQVGDPIRLRARTRDVSGGETVDQDVRLETHDTEFEVALLPSTAKCGPRWRLEARGHGYQHWEIVRALRRAAPGGGRETRLLILARERR